MFAKISSPNHITPAQGEQWKKPVTRNLTDTIKNFVFIAKNCPRFSNPGEKVIYLWLVIFK